MTRQQVPPETAKRFYVYAHFEQDTGRLFYIGKGTGRRLRTSSGRNKHWHSVSKAHGFHPVMIVGGLSERDAFDIEAALVSLYPAGSLATYTAGGGGTSGFRHSQAARRKMSLDRLGRQHSPSARAKMSKTIRESPELIEARRAAFSGESNPAKSEGVRQASRHRMMTNNPMFDPVIRKKAGRPGRVTGVETKAKISTALKGRKRGPMPASVAAALQAVRETRMRPVKTGCGLLFGSTAEAARSTGVRQGNIVNCCAGRAKSAGGYVWSYTDE